MSCIDLARATGRIFPLVLVLAACKGGSDGGAGSGGAPGGGAGGGGPGGGAGAVPVNADVVAEDLALAVASIEAGDSVALSWSVRNAGPDPVPTFRVGAYLSEDDAFDVADVRLATWTSPGLAADETFMTSGTVQVPVATGTGSYRMLLFVDDLLGLDETDETNNVASSPTSLSVAPASHPDLVTSSVTFGPGAIQAGETVDVSDECQNIGVEASASFRVGIYLSADALITSADLLIGQRSVTSLGVGSASSGSGPMTVPSFVAAGVYFVGAVADDLDQVVEMDELNNGQASNATVTISAAPLPDLAAAGITFGPLTQDAGQPITVDETVVNQGAAASPLFQVGIFLSDDVTIDPAEDVRIGTRSITTLPVGGGSSSGPTNLVIPGDTPGGEYFVGLFADPGDMIPETDEGNNGLVATNRVTVTVPPLPDLVPTAFTFSPTIVGSGSGSTLSIAYDVVNNGVVASVPVRVGIYVSSDSTITINDVLLGTADLPALVPGAGAGLNVDLPVPGGVATGSYRVGLWVDDNEVQPEIDDGNNLFVSTTFLDISGGGAAAPNLVPELIDPMQLIAAPGSSLQVVTRVANIGDASTPLFRVGVYLSDDDQIGPDDTRIGDRLVPFGLGATFASVASAPVTIPASTPEGLYHIGVIADWQDVVAESDESDNSLAALQQFEVREPPPPSAELFPSVVNVLEVGPFTAGQALDVDHAIRNVGALDAASFRVGFYLSQDAVIDTTDVLLGSRVVVGLAAAATDGAVTTIQIPAGTAPGPWRIGVFVDDQGAIPENDESDNGVADDDTFTIQ